MTFIFSYHSEQTISSPTAFPRHWDPDMMIFKSTSADSHSRWSRLFTHYCADILSRSPCAVPLLGNTEVSRSCDLTSPRNKTSPASVMLRLYETLTESIHVLGLYTFVKGVINDESFISKRKSATFCFKSKNSDNFPLAEFVVRSFSPEISFGFFDLVSGSVDIKMPLRVGFTDRWCKRIGENPDYNLNIFLC